jgi:hypothetical protein
MIYLFQFNGNVTDNDTETVAEAVDAEENN